MNDEQQIDAIAQATDVTVAWLANPHTRVAADEIPTFLTAVHAAVQALGTPQASIQPVAAPEDHTPATTPRKSLKTPGRIISMIDGKPYASLKRHLKAHGLTPDTYRKRYGLKADYPMVSPEYSEARRQTANKSGLGQKPGQTTNTSGAAGKPIKVAKAARKTITRALESARERLGGDARAAPNDGAE